MKIVCLKFQQNTLTVTGNKNDRIEDANNNENSDNVLASNEDLNNKKTKCSQMITFNVGIDKVPLSTQDCY